MTDHAEPLSLLTRSQVEQRCAISRSQIYKRLSAGEFPEPVRVGAGVRWRTDDIASWIQALPKATGNVGAA